MRPLALLIVAHLAALLAVAAAKGGAAGAGLNDDVLGLIVFKADVSDPEGRLATWSEESCGFGCDRHGSSGNLATIFRSTS